MPTVSVIMPVHNRETRLPGAVESILDQRYRDFELLVVDDGSTDRTPSVIDHYAALDRRVRHLGLPVNGGPGLARSMALKAASGDYVAIMDSDDVALAERLGRQVSFMEANPHVTLAGANAIKVMPQGRVQMKMAPGDAELKARLLLVDATFVHPTVMMRRQFLVQHRLTYSAERICDEDHDLYIRMVQAGATLANMPDTLLEYHRHGQNITANAPHLEEGKTPLRRILLGLYYPDLTQREAAALAEVLQPSPRLSAKQAFAGLLAADKAMTMQHSQFGEDHQVLNAIIKRYTDPLSRALASMMQR